MKNEKCYEIIAKTAGMPKETWLKIRREGIGGSDAAAIAGLSKWSTPFSVWTDKIGELPAKEETEAMRQGKDLEQYVAQRFELATGRKVKRLNALIRSKAQPFMLANVDRLVVGENAGLECKTTSSLNLKRFAGGEFPDEYYAQCVHYMAVTGADRWYLAVLVLGRDFLTYTIERDDEEIAALVKAEKAFWENYVIPRVAPPVDGKEPTTEAIKTIYADSREDAEVADLFPLQDRAEKYFELQAVIKTLQEQQEEIKQAIMAQMGEAEVGFAGRYKATWKSQTRTTYDMKRLAEDHPDINIKEYAKTTTSRPFSLKEMAQSKED